MCCILGPLLDHLAVLFPADLKVLPDIDARPEYCVDPAVDCHLASYSLLLGFYERFIGNDCLPMCDGGPRGPPYRWTLQRARCFADAATGEGELCFKVVITVVMYTFSPSVRIAAQTLLGFGTENLPQHGEIIGPHPHHSPAGEVVVEMNVVLGDHPLRQVKITSCLRLRVAKGDTLWK